MGRVGICEVKHSTNDNKISPVSVIIVNIVGHTQVWHMECKHKVNRLWMGQKGKESPSRFSIFWKGEDKFRNNLAWGDVVNRNLAVNLSCANYAIS